MELHHIFYEAGGLDRGAPRTHFHAKPIDAQSTAPRRRGARSIVGHALMNLGRLICAEPTHASAHFGR